MTLAPSLVAHFDASLHEADDDRPASAAVGVLVEEGTTAHVERSLSVDAFVSSTGLEFRALVETARAIDDRFDRVASVHLHGDADAVVEAVDPDRAATPPDAVAARRVRETRRLLADVPVVTYRSVPRWRNERAHDLARAGHR